MCERVLADPAACPQAIERAVIGGTIALALMGRLDQVAVVAARAHQVEDQVEGLLRHLGAFGEISGLVFAGDFDTAEQRSADIVRISSPGQYLAWGMGNVLASTVEVARGRFPDAVSRMEQTVAALTSESTRGVGLPGAVAAGPILLRAGPSRARRKDGGRAADPVRTPSGGV